MKKIIIVFILWLISFGFVWYVENYKETPENIIKKNNKYIKNMLWKSFYKITLENIWLDKIIWYKNEFLNKTADWYKYVYTINVANKNLSIEDISSKGEILFDGFWNIKDIRILLNKKFLIKWEKEKDTDKIMISFENLDNKWLKENKLMDIEQADLEFFLIKTLPFRNLKIWKDYTYDVISPAFLKKSSWVNSNKLRIKKKSEKKYIVSNSIASKNIQTEVVFNDDNKIVMQKVFLLKFQLVNSIEEKNKIINQVKNINLPKKKNKKVYKESKSNNKKADTEKIDISKNEIEDVNIFKEIENIKKNWIKKCNLLLK